MGGGGSECGKRKRKRKRKEGFTVKNSLSRRGGYRGGCGAKEGEDFERRTPKRFHRLLPLRDAAGCAWERTKVIDGSVGSCDRILSGSHCKHKRQTRKKDRRESRERDEGRGGARGISSGGWEEAAGCAGLICSCPDHPPSERSNHTHQALAQICDRS